MRKESVGGGMKSGGSGCFVLINKSEDSLLTMSDNLADGWSPETDRALTSAN